MKKNLLFLLPLFLMFSCSQDENLNDASTPVQLRSDASPSEIADLVGLEVNIRLADTNRKPRYLSAHKKANSADLINDGDDGWQKWFILNDRYDPAYGVFNGMTFDLKTNSSPKYGSYLYTHGNFKYPGLTKVPIGVGPLWHIQRIPGTAYYRLGLNNGHGIITYLSAVNDSSGALCFEPINTTNTKRQAWEIVPLEGFDLIGIEYDLEGGTIKNKAMKTFQVAPAINQTSQSVNREFTINQKYSETSSFSQTEGVKLSTNVTTSMSVGVPAVSEGKISTSISSEKSWTYSSGQTETREFAITDKYSYVLEPNSSYTISVIGVEYTMEVGYSAVYRSKVSGKAVRLNGIWKGVTITETQVILKDNNNNVIIDKKALIPQ